MCRLISRIGELYYKTPTNKLLLSNFIVEMVVKRIVCTLLHSWSARRRHFTRSNQRALKKNNSRSRDVSVKAKAHRGEPANEEADIQADKAISSNDVPTEWHDRTN